MDEILSSPVERYIDELTDPQVDDPVLDEMEAYAREHDFPIVGRTVGLALELLARAVGARTVVELGSGYGYSAWFFARAVGDGGTVVCSDLDPANGERAEDYLRRSGLWDRVDFRVGDAADVLASVDGDLDVVFCDADKGRYPEHWRNVSDRVRRGGLYLCDNTLWHGRAATGEPTPERPGWTEAVVEHNRLVADDPRYLSLLLPLRDGLLTALRVT